MAVKDLERHLGIGWQTIATLAGAIVSLSLGQKGDLPLPFAVSAALMVSFWGVLNILDSNYWAVRAIAFLANVEALYFYQQDRKVFHKYAGEHPPLSLMNSLKYQMYVAVSFIGISLLFYLAKVRQRAGGLTPGALAVKAAPLSYFDAGLWLLPVAVALLGANVAVVAYHKRIAHYLDFVTESPGPGMVTDRQRKRSIDLVDASIPVIAGEEIQRARRQQLETAKGKWRAGKRTLRISSWVLFILLVAAVLGKGSLASFFAR
jgi:hypothetical protein